MSFGRYVLFAVGLVFLAGVLMAIQGATTNNVAASGAVQTRWTGSTASSNVTEGGNITLMNITATTLTDRWAVYYGNITGTIVLSTSTGNANIYSWTFATTNGGEVCMSTGSALTYSSPASAVAATVDTNFGMGSVADNVASTVGTANCTLVLSSGTVTSGIQWRHLGNSTFWTCAITSDGATTKNFDSFCTNISSTGKYFGSSTAGNANYELMIPTTPGSGTETYYFYAELG
ncbi:MAG: hypothetical protein NTV88_04815 [Candidatus Micrarchaeota archaeon]|nr:hypothetical protein [Candidatus Micrarchaeota archaeon]